MQNFVRMCTSRVENWAGVENIERKWNDKGNSKTRDANIDTVIVVKQNVKLKS